MATAKQVSVLEEILKWSADRPAWQRDALRRLVQNGGLTGEDVQLLTLSCKAQHSLAPAVATEPLSADHIPTRPVAGRTVTLSGIRDVRNANALAPKQTLKFGGTGLTIVYGDNGSGKSGYARILKRACRARARGETILPNVFGTPTNEPAQATLLYRVEGSDKPPFEWRDNRSGSSELSAVSFFDAECAAVQVKDPNDLAFTPFGLDVFEKLAAACKSIKAALDQEKKVLDTAKPAALRLPKAKPNTLAAKLCAGLTGSSCIEQTRTQAFLSPEDTKRLAHVRSLRDDDPQKAISALRAQQQRLAQLLELVSSLLGVLNNGDTSTFREATSAAQTTAEAAKLAAARSFPEEPLNGVGTDVWKSLWESARRYSEQAANLGKPFPVPDGGERCVLCQQELDETAAARLLRFEAFVADDTQKKTEEATRRVQALFRSLSGLRISPRVYRHTLSDIEDYSTEAVTEARRFFITAWLLRRQVLNGIGSTNWSEPAAALSQDPTSALETVAAEIGARIVEVQNSKSATERAKLMSELDELEGREWLATVLDDVGAEIERLQKLDRLQLCMKDTDTSAITSKGGTLTDEVVTNALRDRFAEEIARLEMGHARVELVAAGGKYGAKRYQVQLIAAPGAGVHRVLSEGEHRCIAIAGFLAELATSNDRSALVFDDPVSSLDHRHRDTVAKRLVEEAQERQVIVFTHDVVFAFKLDKWASSNHVEPYQQSVNRNLSQPGFCSPDAPLRVKAVRLSIVHLRTRAKQITELYAAGKVPDYEEQARSLFGRIRETWEQAVAEALSPVMNRFERDVDTKKLRALTVLTDEDCDIVDAQRAICARYQHNESGAVNEPMGEPEQIMSALDALQKWTDSVFQKQRAVEQGKQSIVKPTVLGPGAVAEALQ